MTIRGIVVLPYVFVAILVPTVTAQTTSGAVVGTVTDPSGAAVVAADVTLIQPATGVQRKAQTQANGGFAFNAVDPGTYTLTVEAKGFKRMERTSVSLRGFWRSDSCRWIVVICRIRLNSEAEQPGDEETLAHRIPFCQPPHSALPNHVYCFDSL
jgi:hypothetical protein